MNPHRCCQIATNRPRSEPIAAQSTDDGPHRLKIGRRFVDLAGWGAAAAILALLPKCPVCLALYVMVWTGVWLPLTTATYLRASLLILCVASLLCLTAMFLYRYPFVKEALSRAKGRRSTIRPKENTQ
ncbi:MAG: hypothetical protein ACM319_05460 [Deltaproteobacteria bacterium]